MTAVIESLTHSNRSNPTTLPLNISPAQTLPSLITLDHPNFHLPYHRKWKSYLLPDRHRRPRRILSSNNNPSSTHNAPSRRSRTS
jgi:hypothetical protein